ncbi:MAG: dihydrolipoyl dehydrogenase [Bdellovibrionota bacterium]
MTNNTYDLVVIGAGPGGEVGVIRAAQLGLKVALVEKNEHLGGTCLNVGCIPTKALLESAKIWEKINHVEDFGFALENPSYSWDKIMSRKEDIVNAQRKGLKFLMKKNKVDVYHGHGRFVSSDNLEVTSPDGSKTSISAKHFLVATGSRVKEIPFAKSNGKTIMTSDDILFIDKVPKSLCVVGGGVVGMEFASLFARFGTSVTVVEMAEQMLPSEDEEVVKELCRLFRKQKIILKTNSKLSKVESKAHSCLVTIEGEDPQEFDLLLSSIGRAPVSDELGLDNVGIFPDKFGFIGVDNHYRTPVKNVFAIGDVIKTPALAHTASAEAIHAVEIIAGQHPHVIDYQTNPGAIYTSPEIASMGMNEQTLRKNGVEYSVAKFPFAPMAKAKIEGSTDGFVKIIFEPKYREILGVHIIGAKATEMISEFVLGKVLETTVDEIGHAIHPHPTISETVMEAAHAAIGGAIHL